MTEDKRESRQTETSSALTGETRAFTAKIPPTSVALARLIQELVRRDLKLSSLHVTSNGSDMLVEAAVYGHGEALRRLDLALAHHAVVYGYAPMTEVGACA